jgi:hypothetical protein
MRKAPVPGAFLFQENLFGGGAKLATGGACSRAYATGAHVPGLRFFIHHRGRFLFTTEDTENTEGMRSGVLITAKAQVRKEGRGRRSLVQCDRAGFGFSLWRRASAG